MLERRDKKWWKIQSVMHGGLINACPILSPNFDFRLYPPQRHPHFIWFQLSSDPTQMPYIPPLLHPPKSSKMLTARCGERHAEGDHVGLPLLVPFYIQVNIIWGATSLSIPASYLLLFSLSILQTSPPTVSNTPPLSPLVHLCGDAHAYTRVSTQCFQILLYS